MRLLLDTHIWLWYIVGDNRLTARERKAIGDTENELWLSPFSIWEAVRLGEKGRIEMNDQPTVWVDRRLQEFELFEAPFTSQTALLSRTLEFHHEDPVDRFLAATAHENKCVFMTHDANLVSLNWLRTF